VYTQTLFPATLYITGGSGVTVRIIRERDFVDLPYASGMNVLLSPGDVLRVEYTAAPALTSVPQR